MSGTSIKRFLLVFGLYLCIVLFGGCGKDNNHDMKTSAEQEVEIYLDQFLQALNKKDIETAYALSIHEYPDSEDSFKEVFQQILTIWGEEKEYTLMKTEEAERPADGKRPATIIHTFSVKTEDGNFQASMSVNGEKGINYFLLTQMSNSDSG